MSNDKRKELMKITRATFGFGGYDDAQFGLSLSFEGKGCGTDTFIGAWSFPPSEHAQWTVADQSQLFADAVRLLVSTLTDAKKKHVGELVGVPVEVTFEGNMLKEWRVLTELIL